jgi:hypothetical protein
MTRSRSSSICRRENSCSAASSNLVAAMMMMIVRARENEREETHFCAWHPPELGQAALRALAWTTDPSRASHRSASVPPNDPSATKSKDDDQRE